MVAGKRGGAQREGSSSFGESKERRAQPGRHKSCFFCRDKIGSIDYKDIGQLRRFVSDRGKIRGRGQTGSCRKHQAQVATAVKRAREMALLPYIGESAPPAHRPRA
jgi:small subunit ribosomal protein S18